MAETEFDDWAKRFEAQPATSWHERACLQDAVARSRKSSSL